MPWNRQAGSLSEVCWIGVEQDMDARMVGAMTTQPPSVGTLLVEYLNQLLGDVGEPDDARSFA